MNYLPTISDAVFDPRTAIAVGLGDAYLSRDGERVWEEAKMDKVESWGDFLTGEEAEAIAASAPDHDWRIRLYGPLKGEEYQRQGNNLWYLVAEDEGFA